MEFVPLTPDLSRVLKAVLDRGMASGFELQSLTGISDVAALQANVTLLVDRHFLAASGNWQNPKEFGWSQFSVPPSTKPFVAQVLGFTPTQ